MGPADASAKDAAAPTARAIAQRIGRYRFADVARQLDELGFARLPGLLEPPECDSLIASFDRPDAFRSTIEMQRHAYGNGRYRYFANPLPPLVAALRAALYPPLARIANEWGEVLRIDTRYPATLGGFLEECHAAGQQRPTPLLLHYGAGGYNRMHQDLYGAVAFPLQVACVLSAPGESFRGGEFLISEGRPRMQTRATAVNPLRGEGLVFANAIRPVASARGHARATMRHGLSNVTEGERYALGVIFHDAE